MNLSWFMKRFHFPGQKWCGSVDVSLLQNWHDSEHAGFHLTAPVLLAPFMSGYFALIPFPSLPFPSLPFPSGCHFDESVECVHQSKVDLNPCSNRQPGQPRQMKLPANNHSLATLKWVKAKEGKE